MKAAPHVGKELELMLAGEKPLSMFYCGTMNGLEYEYVPEEEFDAYVQLGLFLKDVFEFQISENPMITIRYVLYSLKEEAWRLPALRMIIQVRNKIGRTEESIDRIIGKLLGYPDEEIDDYIEAGRHTVYLRR
jgi:hypothetical protein